MATVSVPSGNVTTVGRFTTVSVERMATFGWLMIGALMYEPNGPGLVIVKVLVARSTAVLFLARIKENLQSWDWDQELR